MKKAFDRCPAVIDERRLYGFSWMEHVLAIPSPLVAVATYIIEGHVHPLPVLIRRNDDSPTDSENIVRNPGIWPVQVRALTDS